MRNECRGFQVQTVYPSISQGVHGNLINLSCLAHNAKWACRHGELNDNSNKHKSLHLIKGRSKRTVTGS